MSRRPAFVSRLADNVLVRGVGRLPMRLLRKQLIAFVGTVVLLVILGVLGLRILSDESQRTSALLSLEQRKPVYQELRDESNQIVYLLVVQYANAFNNGVYDPEDVLRVASSSTDAVEADFSVLGRLIEDARADPAGDAVILTKIHADFASLQTVITQVAGLQQAAFAETGSVLLGKINAFETIVNAKAVPAAVDLRGLADQLNAGIDGQSANLASQNSASNANSQHLFIGVATGCIVLALLLGLVLTLSVVGPLRKVNSRLAGIAAGDFSEHVDVPNRDELGALADNVNRMNDQLGRLYKEVETTSRHKSEFLANMSHELRTPLNAVIGFSDVLLDRLFGELNEKQAEYVKDINGSGRHLLALINDILDLSKIEAGRMELQVSSFDLTELLQNTTALLRERATRQGVSLMVDADPSFGVISADERKVKQVLFNLLSNAVKFTNRGGHVTVTARGEGHDVIISVRDDGVGIAPADQARIFEQFVQVGTSHLQEGTGLGLALSRRFIELHGGRLWLESELGKGSTFNFLLPGSRGRQASSPRTDPVASGDPAVASRNTPTAS